MARYLTRLLIALICLPGMTASAQTLKDGPHIGYAMGGDVQDDDLAYGWQVTYEFNDAIGLDLSITRQEDKFDGADLDFGSLPGIADLDLDIWALALTGRAGFLLTDRVYVYAGGGGGYYFFDEDAENIRVALSASDPRGPGGGTITSASADIDNDLGFHLAAGVEIMLASSWELFAEYRRVWFDTDAQLTSVETLPVEDIGKSKLTYKRDGTFDYDYGLIRFGLNYRF